MKEIQIYTDGACSGNPGPGGWAAIIIYEGVEKEIFGYKPHTTNNRMELTAVIEALRILKYPCIVTVYSDSSYVVNSVNMNWLKSWQKNNFYKKGELIPNADLWQQLLEQFNIHRVNFVKVKGHSDNVYNNRCDRLAVNCIKKQNIVSVE